MQACSARIRAGVRPYRRVRRRVCVGEVKVPGTSTPNAVKEAVEDLVAADVLDNIVAAASNSSVSLTGVSIAGVAPPAAQSSTTAVVTSSLTFTGLSAEDAMSLEAEIAAGIASSLPGVAADEVSITGYETADDGSLVVSFEVRLALCRDGACFPDGRVQPSTEQCNSSLPTPAVHIDGPSKFGLGTLQIRKVARVQCRVPVDTTVPYQLCPCR